MVSTQTLPARAVWGAHVVLTMLFDLHATRAVVVGRRGGGAE